FCLFVGTALAYVVCANRVLGTAAMLAVIGVFSASTYNHFTNPRYAKEDIRSAVTFWRQAGRLEPLLAIGSLWTTQRYLKSAEEKRLFFFDHTDVVSSIEQVFSSQSASSVYVLLTRDWHRARETTIRNAFRITQERAYPGVKIFRISRPRKIEFSDAS